MSRDIRIVIDTSLVANLVLKITNEYFNHLRIQQIDTYTAARWANALIKDTLDSQTFMGGQYPGHFLKEEIKNTHKCGTLRFRDMEEYSAVMQDYSQINPNDPSMVAQRDAELAAVGTYSLYDLWIDTVYPLLDDVEVLDTSLHPFKQNVKDYVFRTLSYDSNAGTLLIYVGEDVRDIVFRKMVEKEGGAAVAEMISNDIVSKSNLISTKDRKRPGGVPWNIMNPRFQKEIMRMVPERRDSYMEQTLAIAGDERLFGQPRSGELVEDATVMQMATKMLKSLKKDESKEAPASTIVVS